MDNQIICKILNQYAYRQRTNWYFSDSGFYESIFINDTKINPNFECDAINLDEFGAIAICERLVKQSSDDDLKTIVLSITKPLQDEITRLEKELASFRANAAAMLVAQSEFRHPAFIKVTEEGFTVTGIETKPE